MARCASRLVRAATVLALGAATVAVPIGASPAAAQSSALLPPLGDCAGAVPIVVASDAAAQSDVYSAVTLAGVLDAVDPDSGSCIVLAGHRDGTMPAAQLARLKTARVSGYVVGGVAAVGDEKAPSGFTRIAGGSRWATARNIGVAAFRLARGNQPDAAAFPSGTGHGASATANSPALPPLDDCSGTTPIVVASDLAAQSDIYSAVTLAGVLDAVDADSKSCIVLGGHRDGTMPPDQSTRLDASVGHGYVVGGASAVARAKAPQLFHRVSGADRWETARAVGAVALETALPSLSEQPPTGQQVVERAEVDAAGATLAAGHLEVTVPAGALSEDASLLVREPFGQVGHLIGGDIVEVEHTQPINKPITVVWDVSELNEFQQAVLVLVRWDEQEQRWQADDTDFDIVDGRLTAHFSEWSFRSWFSNVGQTLGEIIGVKVDAPKCAGPIPEWITRADDPDEHSNSASIRLCYEDAGDSAVMKTANNRTISRLVYPTGDIEWTSNPSPYDSIADWAVGTTIGRWLEDDTRVYFLPLQSRNIQLQRPQTSGTNSVTFQTDHLELKLVLADVVYTIVEQFELPFVDRHLITQVLSPIVECAVARVLSLVGTPLREWPVAIGRLLQDCFTSQRNIIDSGIEATEAAADKAHSTSSSPTSRTISQGFKNAVAIVDYLKLGFRFADNFTTPKEAWTVSTQTDQTGIGYSTEIADGDRSCGVRSYRYVTCWGPTVVKFQSVSAGGTHSCGVRSYLYVTCWGENTWGQSDAPLEFFASVSAGGYHSCGVRTNGTAVCWGNNSQRQTDAPSGSFTSLSAGFYHSCGVRTNGTAVCWGNNYQGKTDAPSGSFTSVSAGGHHSCGLRSNGTAVCWGNNDYGQTDAPSGSFTSVSAGAWFSCGLRSNGTAVCWGNEVIGQSDAPSGTFRSLSAGFYHSCGVRINGTAVCWGNNINGQSDVPSASFASLSAGTYHSCGVRTNGAAVCWGSNLDGEADVS